jgi:bifunctional DNase/RNase
MSTSPRGFTQVEVRAVIAEPSSQSPVVLLQPLDGKVLLPIWVGPFEGQAIAMAAEGIEAPRPMTHDLLLSVIETAGLSVAAVHIHTLAENVFHASLDLEGVLAGSRGDLHSVDARPSDAIALALRAKAPIMVSDDVLAAAQVEEHSTEEALRLILEKLRPEDLGEYEM